MTIRRFSIIAAIAVITAMPLSALAQTYVGPTATPPGNNAPGPVWLSPSSQQSGNINISGTQTIGTTETLGSDLYMTSSKAIQVNSNSAATNLNVGNWGTNTNFELDINGNISVHDADKTAPYSGSLSASKLCLNTTGDMTTNCITVWPSAGGGGTITGGGTTGNVPLYTGPTAIGNSIVSQVGNDVKIISTDNTTNPYLTVLPQNLSQSVNIGYNHVYEGGTNGNNPMNIDSQGTGALVLQANGGTGNVGIKTSDPSMAGTYDALALSRGAGGIYGLTTNVTGQWYMSLATEGANRLNVMDNGNVGIGTTAPADKLEINGNLRFTVANPNITASSYFIAPGGAYFNSGTVYAEAPIQARGGVHNDTGTNLVLSGGTSNNTYISGTAGIGALPNGTTQVNVATPGGPGMTAITANGSSMGGNFTGSNTGLTGNGATTGLVGVGGSAGAGGTGVSGSGGFQGATFGNSTTPGNNAQIGTSNSGVVANGTSYGVQATSLIGLYGAGTGASGYGVWGSGSGAAGTGVYGSGPQYALYGMGGTYGLYAFGNTYGVYAQGGAGGYSFFGNGGTLYNAGNVGIGNSTPNSQLEIGTNTAFTGRRLRLLGYANSPGQGSGVDGNLEIGDGGVVYWRMSRNSGNSFQTNMSASWGIMGGNVGINQLSPSQPLDVNGAALLEGGGPLYLNDTNHGIKSTPGAGVTIFTYQEPNGIFLQQSTGNVGIGLTNPNYNISLPDNGALGIGGVRMIVHGSGPGSDIRFGTGGDSFTGGFDWDTSGTTRMTLTAGGNLWAAGTITPGSDRDLKQDISKLTKYSIADIMKLQAVTFEYKADPSTPQIGFIAQDVKKIMPEFVVGKAISEGGTGLGVNYNGMVSVLTKGMQDQQHEIDTLKAQNEDLLKRLSALEAKVK